MQGMGRRRKGREASAPAPLLVGLQEQWDVRRGNAELLEILRRIRTAVASGDLPVGSGPMQHDRKIAFVGVGSAERPIVRNGDMQDLSELFPHNLSHLLNVLRIAKVRGDGWDNEAEKGDSGSQGNVSA
jgi:hypothetical protein